MVRWIWKVRPENRISVEKIRGPRLTLKSMKECLQDRRLQWFVGIERMKKSAQRSFKVNCGFTGGSPKQTWKEVIRRDLKEYKVSKDAAKDKNV